MFNLIYTNSDSIFMLDKPIQHNIGDTTYFPRLAPKVDLNAHFLKICQIVKLDAILTKVIHEFSQGFNLTYPLHINI